MSRYDVGESEGRLFLSMEFADGEDLESLLRRIGRLPEDKAVDFGSPIPRPKIHKHRLPRDCEIRAKDILGGLYHEYWLKQRVA